jgi:hypothetical protein
MPHSGCQHPAASLLRPIRGPGLAEPIRRDRARLLLITIEPRPVATRLRTHPSTRVSFHASPKDMLVWRDRRWTYGEVDRRIDAEQLANHTTDAALPPVGTSSFIGEGFECPALDAVPRHPITFKNRLVQYLERLSPPHPATATVRRYHDELTPVLAASLRKREPGYTKLGFREPRNWSVGAPD